jgi:hypothetical protein
VTTPAFEAALRASAAGLYPLEAGVDLLIAHRWLLDRSDFRDRFIHHGISITDGTTEMAEIDWAAATTALETGDLPPREAKGESCAWRQALPTGFPSTCATLSPASTTTTSIG